MAKVIDPICTWCNKPDSKCVCESAEVLKKPVKAKPIPGVDALTFVMEIFGVLLFFVGFAALFFLIVLSFTTRGDREPTTIASAAVSYVGFFSTFGVMVSGCIIFLLGRINHRLWTT